MTLDIYKILNRAQNQSEAIYQILQKIKEQTGVSATGIRIEENGDYPYYFYDGFSETHIKMENSLCEELEGVKHLACMCGRVLEGKINPNLKFFTAGGSFWTNNSDKLIVTTGENELGNTRNICNREGYLSIALIPLKSSNGIIGLLQLNDEKPDKFALELIRLLERLGESIGIALARLDEENKRKELEIDREQLLKKYMLRIKELDSLYRISKLQENQDLSVDDILKLIVNLIPTSMQYPESAVAKITVENHSYTSRDYKDTLCKYSALIQNYGLIVGRLVVGYITKNSMENIIFLEDEIKLINLIAETISRMLERNKTGEWQKSLDKYALILNDEEIKHITKLVLEDMAIGEMDREEYNINDLPDEKTQSIDSYMSLQLNLEVNRKLVLKLKNLINTDEPI